MAVYYAVKANPDPRLLACLHAAGCRFEAASWTEVRAAVRWCDPGTVLYTNPVKPAADIARAWRAGVWRFAADSGAELHKIAHQAPGAAVLLAAGSVARLGARAGSASATRARFGVPPGQVPGLARLAASLGLRPYGLAFHVGSQMMDPRGLGRPDPPVRHAS